MPPLSHNTPAILPTTNHPQHQPSLGNNSLPPLPPTGGYPVLTQQQPLLPQPSISTSILSSHLPSVTASSSSSGAGMTHFMQGLHNALNPHQSSSIPFSNHLGTGTVAPFANTLTSMAGSFTNPSPSLPLIPAIYPYSPYGGVGSVPVVQSGPVNIGVVGGSSINTNSSPGNLPTAAPFPSHSLMPTYSSYIPSTIYPNNQTPSST